jgi:Cse1
VLRADALKFTMTFRAQIPRADVLAAFPGIVALLGSESNVVHSQAAMCIDQLLVMKVRPMGRIGIRACACSTKPSRVTIALHFMCVHGF